MPDHTLRIRDYSQVSRKVLNCEQPGWFPTAFGLKDHTVFFYDGYTYILSNYIPGEDRFAYARSQDWCDWEELGSVLSERTPGREDEMAIWAPYVVEESGIYYVFYTGVTADFTQSILLASSDDPADPASWQEQGVVFQPTHPQAVWTAGEWADCRDPMIIRAGQTYYLYYTGRDLDETGEHGIIGLATAASLQGPWLDHGAIVSLTSTSRFGLLTVPESSTVFEYESFYYLFYHDTSLGEHYRISENPEGPWSPAYPFRPGWAHEVWTDQDSQSHTSYLTNYTITISPISWTLGASPPRPFIGREISQLFLPIAFLPVP